MAKVATGVVTPGLSGSTGSATFVRTLEGVQLRTRTAPRDRQTPAQVAARERMVRAGRAWLALTPEQAAAWRHYARAEQEAQGTLLVGRLETGQEAFTRLALKALQVDPTREIPVAPPASPFPGDGVRLAVSAVPGAVRFTASAPNADGVVMELLLQRLLSVHRTPYARRYRSVAFVAFAGAGETADLPATPGVWATATRLVYSPTGEYSRLLPLGLVTVPAG